MKAPCQASSGQLIGSDKIGVPRVLGLRPLLPRQGDPRGGSPQRGHRREVRRVRAVRLRVRARAATRCATTRRACGTCSTPARPVVAVLASEFVAAHAPHASRRGRARARGPRLLRGREHGARRGDGGARVRQPVQTRGRVPGPSFDVPGRRSSGCAATIRRSCRRSRRSCRRTSRRRVSCASCTGRTSPSSTSARATPARTRSATPQLEGAVDVAIDFARAQADARLRAAQGGRAAPGRGAVRRQQALADQGALAHRRLPARPALQPKRSRHGRARHPRPSRRRRCAVRPRARRVGPRHRRHADVRGVHRRADGQPGDVA